MKKLLSVFTAMIFAMSAFSGTAQAETAGAVKKEVVIKAPMGGFIPSGKIIAGYADARGPKLFSGTYSSSGCYDYWSVYGSIEAQLRMHEPYVILYDNGYTVPYEEAIDIYRRVLYDNCDLLVLDFGFEQGDSSFEYRETDGYMAYIVPGYYYDDVEGGEAGARAMMDEMIEGYLDLAEEVPDIIGKLLVMHDALCKDITYAEDELAATPNDNHLRTVYDTFNSGKTVCQGYALTFKALCDALNERLKSEYATEYTAASGTHGNTSGTAANASSGGSTAYMAVPDIIQTVICASEAMDHMWDIVNIDGEWYHIDPTWADMDGDVNYDDPTVCANYEYFLKTDDEYIYPEDTEYVAAHSFDGETDWVIYSDEDIACDDEKYSSGYIFNRFEYGLISFEGGRYNIDTYGYTFLSDTITATELIATEPFLDSLDGVTYNAVVFLTYRPVAVRQIFVRYDENGALLSGSGSNINSGVKFSDATLGSVYELNEKLYRNSTPQKLLIWSPDMSEPLCRAIELPALSE